ncbi:MAG: DUF3793 family protein [Agathobacter sp.]|nr:DUF3793 family protein [Agathobacter sp.]
MDGKGLEKALIHHCAPTLAGLKSAGLFRYFYESRQSAEQEITQVNALLWGKGVYVEALIWNKDSVLIYAYRLNHLQRELQNPETVEILQEYGYAGNDARDCIGYLKKRVCESACFPHEIGIFLGYPPEDVRGFIVNGGQNCKCCGIWKVYCNEQDKIQMFCKFQRCTDIYREVFSKGRRLVQMTVGA